MHVTTPCELRCHNRGPCLPPCPAHRPETARSWSQSASCRAQTSSVLPDPAVTIGWTDIASSLNKPQHTTPHAQALSVDHMYWAVVIKKSNTRSTVIAKLISSNFWTFRNYQWHFVTMRLTYSLVTEINISFNIVQWWLPQMSVTKGNDSDVMCENKDNHVCDWDQCQQCMWLIERGVQWLHGRASDSQLWEPGFESCAVRVMSITE